MKIFFGALSISALMWFGGCNQRACDKPGERCIQVVIDYDEWVKQ